MLVLYQLVAFILYVVYPGTLIPMSWTTEKGFEAVYYWVVNLIGSLMNLFAWSILNFYWIHVAKRYAQMYDGGMEQVANQEQNI